MLHGHQGQKTCEPASGAENINISQGAGVGRASGEGGIFHPNRA
jgi:hypothetical protein